MISSRDKSIFADWEKLGEMEPTPRKYVDGRIIYKSQSFSRERGDIKYGLPVLSDFGEARIGKVHSGLIQPDIYRAPEVVLGMEWTSKVDIWNVWALMSSYFFPFICSLLGGLQYWCVIRSEIYLRIIIYLMAEDPTACIQTSIFWLKW